MTIVVQPLGLGDYGIQFDKTVRPSSGRAGSLLFTRNRKLCLPPMPSGMVNSIERVVDFPAAKTIAPMVAVGGQHPSTTSTSGTAANSNVPVPVLLNVNTACTRLPYG